MNFDNDESERESQQFEEIEVRCGCGEYSIDIDSREHVRSIDIICPECKNHFGWEVPEDEFREARGTQREDGVSDIERIRDDLIEALAALEHRQWMHWTQLVARDHDIPDELREKWEENWVEYDYLDDVTKEPDRKWARKVVDILEDRRVLE